MAIGGEFGLSMLTERLLPNQGPRSESFAKPEVSSGENTRSFSDSLKSALGEANEALLKADGAAKDFASGKSGNLHDLMIAMEKAELQLRTISAVRNKVVEAYQEISKMQV
jgi:flagellar hook-basal body complex protein FliE